MRLAAGMFKTIVYHVQSIIIFTNLSKRYLFLDEQDKTVLISVTIQRKEEYTKQLWKRIGRERDGVNCKGYYNNTGENNNAATAAAPCRTRQLPGAHTNKTLPFPPRTALIVAGCCALIYQNHVYVM